jgi:hypothetical protein
LNAFKFKKIKTNLNYLLFTFKFKNIIKFMSFNCNKYNP